MRTTPENMCEGYTSYKVFNGFIMAWLGSLFKLQGFPDGGGLENGFGTLCSALLGAGLPACIDLEKDSSMSEHLDDRSCILVCYR
jgi:hypothetical protein